MRSWPETLGIGKECTGKRTCPPECGGQVVNVIAKARVSTTTACDRCKRVLGRPFPSASRSPARARRTTHRRCRRGLYWSDLVRRQRSESRKPRGPYRRLPEPSKAARTNRNRCRERWSDSV